MSEKKIMPASSLQKGSYVFVEGVPCRVTDIATSKTGKHGAAKCRIEAIGILDEKKRVFIAPGHENVEVPVIEKKSAQVLSVADDTANVMDVDTFETFDMKIPAELKGQIESGTVVMYWDLMGQKIMKQVIKKE